MNEDEIEMHRRMQASNAEAYRGLFVLMAKLMLIPLGIGVLSVVVTILTR